LHDARRRVAQSRDDAQRARLAAARRPEHGQELAPPHLEVEPVEGQGAVAERLADAAQGDDGPLAHGRGLSSSPTFLLTHCVVSDVRMSPVGLVTPAFPNASTNSRIAA